MSSPRSSAAIITGGSGGIGVAVARRLAADGIAVFFPYASGAAEAEALVRAVEAKGGQAQALQADLGDPANASRVFDAAEAAFGAVDILINAAGIMTLGPLAEVEDAAFDRQTAINVGGTFRMLREAARRLSDGGRIVNFSSSVVGLYQPGYGVYAATKGAVEAMTHVLAKELARRGITVNAIAPGPVETPLFMKGKTDELVRAIAAANPFGRLGQPDDIARAVAFLVGPDGGWINGQVIRANGEIV